MITKEKLDFGISYAEKQIAKEKNPILLNLLKNNSTNKKVKILDVGCGFGGHSMWYAQFDNCEVYGLDVDANHIEVAKKLKLKYKKDNVTFEKRNILDEPLKKDELFDLVTFNDVVEHIPISALIEILSQVSKHLTPSGKIYFGYPPWESPYAAHVYRAVKIPWIQYLPENLVLKLITKNNQEIVGDIESDLIQAYNGLNRINHKQIMKIINDLNLTPVVRKSHCILNRFSLLKNINFSFFPFRYLITYEILVLQNK